MLNKIIQQKNKFDYNYFATTHNNIEINSNIDKENF